MKKKMLVILLAAGMLLSMAACGKEKPVVSTVYGKTETTGTCESGVVLGGEFEPNYTGFTYLSGETLVTGDAQKEETGEKESLRVFVPTGGYKSVNGEIAYADDMGVNFTVELNPYMQFREEKYLPEENLTCFLDYEYDEFFSTAYKDLEISEVKKEGNGVRATVSYCCYDKWNELYYPVYCTYFYTELSRGLRVLVTVEINLEETTGKTKELLAELESFYGFDIDWNPDAAQKKVDNYVANGITGMDTFSTGYLLFELPLGWEEDYEYGDYTVQAYAPDGDSAHAGCTICIRQEYMGPDSFDITELLEDETAASEFLTEELGETVSELKISDYGTTCLGNAVKVSVTPKDGSCENRTEWYFITNEYYLYSVQATARPDCEEDVFAMAENILENGRVKEW